MIAETLAGIALVKSAVDGIKSAIGTAKDISSIANDIDALLQGQSQVQAESNKKAGVRLADQFGVQSVAKEMIDAGDIDQQLKDKLALKLLRISNVGRDGFILKDFPRVV